MVIIHTYNPEEEIWHHIHKLTNIGYVKKLLRFRIENEFFKQTEFGFDLLQIIEDKKNLRMLKVIIFFHRIMV